MKAFEDCINISISVKVNGIKVNDFNTRVNENIISPQVVIGCFNHIPNCCDPKTEELVDRMKEVLASTTVKELLHQGRIEEILIDAQALAATVIIENEIENLKELLPLVERTQDPSTDEIEKEFAEKYKPYKTYTEVLCKIFAESFIDLGIMKFSAKKGH